MESKFLDKLTNATLTKEKLVQKVLQDPTLIPEILTGVSSSKPAIRYGCGKILLEISKDRPDLLYPHMDFFIALLGSKYRILIWNAIIIIANLTSVDTEKKFDKIFEKYYRLLKNDYMVTVANVVANSWKIAVAKPYLTARITDKLLTVEHRSTTPHLSEECKRVIFEHAINSFDMFFPQIEQKEKVLMFVKQQLTSPRESLKCAAEKFLKKWS
jgi:hypothetical protein